jgi:hypothetical protein
MELEFSPTTFQKNKQISNFMNILQLEPSCSKQMERQTDRQTERERGMEMHDEA